MVLFRWRGVPVLVDPLFLLLLAGIFAYQLAAHGVAGLLVGALAAVLVFSSILAHEFGHASIAMAFGIRVLAVRLHIFGGATLFERHRLTAWRDLWISLAGPLVSLALGAMAGLLYVATGAAVLGGLAWFNVALALFNLIPAVPLDGGRALRALLELLIGRARGARVALGLGTALTLGLLAVAVVSWRIELAIISLLMLGYQRAERAALGQFA